MYHKITGKEIRKQLVGHFSSYIVVLFLIAAILVFCMVFCGSQLKWTHPLTIFCMVALIVICIILFKILVKMIRLRDLSVFQRYGTAEMIAEFINQGMKDPRFISRNRTNPSTLIITEQFIVATSSYKDYLELKDARSMQRVIFPETKPIVMTGDPFTSLAATAGANYAVQKYASGTNYGILTIWDDENVRHEYSVRDDEVNDIVELLSKLAPHIKIKEARPL